MEYLFLGPLYTHSCTNFIFNCIRIFIITFIFKWIVTYILDTWRKYFTKLIWPRLISHTHTQKKENFCRENLSSNILNLTSRYSCNGLRYGLMNRKLQSLPFSFGLLVSYISSQSFICDFFLGDQLVQEDFFEYTKIENLQYKNSSLNQL